MRVRVGALQTAAPGTAAVTAHDVAAMQAALRADFVAADAGWQHWRVRKPSRIWGQSRIRGVGPTPFERMAYVRNIGDQFDFPYAPDVRRGHILPAHFRASEESHETVVVL
jgi:hypothetical protein